MPFDSINGWNVASLSVCFFLCRHITFWLHEARKSWHYKLFAIAFDTFPKHQMIQVTLDFPHHNHYHCRHRCHHHRYRHHHHRRHHHQTPNRAVFIPQQYQLNQSNIYKRFFLTLARSLARNARSLCFPKPCLCFAFQSTLTIHIYLTVSLCYCYHWWLLCVLFFYRSPRSTIAVAALAHFMCFPFYAAGDILFFYEIQTHTSARARSDE